MNRNLGSTAVSDDARAISDASRGLAGSEPSAGAPKLSARPSPARSAAVPAGELTIIGKFENPYRSPAAKAAAIGNGTWSPDVDDFKDVARAGGVAVSYTADDLSFLIGAILNRPKSSVKAINLITHGAPGMIGLSGTIRLPPSGGVPAPSSVYFTRSITADSLDRMAAIPQLKLGGKAYGWADIRSRFAPKATIAVFACHSAATRGGAPSKELLRHLADTFQVRVVGFIDSIKYCIDNPKQRPLRYKLGIGSCADGVSDFHSLVARGRATKRIVEVSP